MHRRKHRRDHQRPSCFDQIAHRDRSVAPSRSCSTSVRVVPAAARRRRLPDRLCCRSSTSASTTPPTRSGRSRHSKELRFRDHPHRHQRLRPHRPPDPEGHPRAPSGRARGGRGQRPGRRPRRTPTCSSTTRPTAASHGEVPCRRQRDRRRRARDPLVQRAGSGRAAVAATSASTSSIESTGIFTDATKAQRPPATPARGR